MCFSSSVFTEVHCRKSGIVNLIHERAGIAIEFDVEALKQALADIIDNPARRAAYARQTALLIKERFETDTIVSRLEALHQDSLI